MSNTNLTGETKSVINCTIFTQPREIEKGAKPGETISDSGKNRLKLVAGNESMELSANDLKINESGKRENGSSRKDMKDFKAKRERQVKFAPYQKQEARKEERQGTDTERDI